MVLVKSDLENIKWTILKKDLSDGKHIYLKSPSKENEEKETTRITMNQKIDDDTPPKKISAKELIEKIVNTISKFDANKIAVPVTYMELYGILGLFLKEVDWEGNKNGKSNDE